MQQHGCKLLQNLTKRWRMRKQSLGVMAAIQQVSQPRLEGCFKHRQHRTEPSLRVQHHQRRYFLHIARVRFLEGWRIVRSREILRIWQGQVSNIIYFSWFACQSGRTIERFRTCRWSVKGAHQWWNLSDTYKDWLQWGVLFLVSLSKVSVVSTQPNQRRSNGKNRTLDPLLCF